MFNNICKMSQETLKKFVAKKLKETHETIIVGDGFLYAQGDFPVLLVAHLDTVHTQLPTEIIYDNKTDSIYSPQGIGGDDRCGVYMVLEVIKKFNCSVLFCEDEEIGCVGAEKFTNTDFSRNLEFNYIIEFDRRGKNDAVFYDCANDAFEEFITKDFFKTAYGSFSDISVIAPYLGCAAVNLSCGYYNAHTTKEYVVMHEMEEVIRQVCKILKRTTEIDSFEYIEAELIYNFNSQYNYFDYGERFFTIEWYDEKTHEYQFEMVDANNKVEAIGRFLMEHPLMSYNDIDIDEYKF